MSTTSLSLAELNIMDRSAFVSRIGWVYEHSPWVVEEAWQHRPFATLELLYSVMESVVRAAPEDKRLALIQAHPDLAGQLAKLGQLTDASNREQAEAGLSELTSELATELDRRNTAYREKLGFPFVICARLNNVKAILAALENRLKHDRETEIALALEEISKIARLRLMDAIS
jgi:2-oxo-4-hydroxy-4-carboxy-5-ureidoimidazoline decarboxylase